MRHGDKINNLGRTTAHRKALMSNLAISLIQHKRITTTLAKARALRVYVEPLITKAKADTTHNRRLVFSKLQDKSSINELFNNIGVKVGDRPGGYTRIIKLAPRFSDSAEMAMIELVDYNEVYNTEKTETKKTRRSRRGSNKSANVAAEKKTEEKAETVETVVEETPEAVTEEVTEAAVEEAPEAPEANAEEAPEAKAEESAEENNTNEEEK